MFLQLTAHFHVFVSGKRKKCQSVNRCSGCLTDDTCKWLLEERKCVDSNATSKLKASLTNINSCPERYEIKSFRPIAGLKHSKTIVNITLKQNDNSEMISINHIMKITIGGHECEKLNFTKLTLYCSVKYHNVSGEIEGPVEIILPSLKLVSKQNFSFVEPEMYDFNPKCGPLKGNTSLTITGRNLAVATDVRVSVDNITCTIVTRENDRVICLTGVSDTTRSGAINVLLDGLNVVNSTNLTFSYTEHPSVDLNQDYKGIVSGGTRLSVHGRFHCAQNPKMFVVDNYNGKRNFEDCVFMQDTTEREAAKTVSCQTPALNKSLNFTIGFTVEYAGQTLDILFPGVDAHPYVLYPDPDFTDFMINGTAVIINGQFGYTGYQLDDLAVQIADTGDKCGVKIVNETTIICQTETVVENAREIIVAVGKVFKTSVTIKDEQQKSEHKDPPVASGRFTPVTIVVTLLIGLVLCAITLTLVKFNRKKQTEKQYLADLRDITAGIGDKLL